MRKKSSNALELLKAGFNFNTKIYLSLFFISVTAVIGIAVIKGYWNRPAFFEGITVEAFGMLFDICILGILFSILLNIAENKREIKRYIEEINDFRGWNEIEASHRIAGNIKRLVNLGSKELPFYNCYLEEAYLVETDLNGADFQSSKLMNAKLLRANLQGANFFWAELREADLRDAKLHKARLRWARLYKARLNRANLMEADLESAFLKNAFLEETVLQGANLQNSYLQKAKLWNANMIKANLKGALLEGADLYGVNLKGADLSEANISKVKNLSLEMLLEVKTLYKVIGLTEDTEAELREKKPDLFKKPLTKNGKIIH